MFVESFAQDLRVGLRVLLKEKSFCALAVGVLALGICAVTTQFAVVNGVLLHAFNFRDSDRLVDVQLVDPTDFSPTNFKSRMSMADFADIREQQTSFSKFVGYLNGSTVNLTFKGHPIRLQGGYVTHDFFRALGVAPALGRDFLPEEDRYGVDKAVLLSDALWRREFGADPSVVGRAVRVNGRSGTIVGVMPPRFAFPGNEDLWIPVTAEFPVRPRNDRGVNFIAVLARLKPGVTMHQAEAELTSIARTFAEQYPDTNGQFTLGYVRPLIAAFTGGPTAGLLYTMLAFCVGVLLIACVNVMNMQFARATLRAKELAIRSSLGATRVRLIRQMLTESLLLASIGAALGIALALWCTDYLNATFHVPDQNQLPYWMMFTIDGRVLLVVVACTMVAAVASGLIPAVMSSRSNTVEIMKEGGRGNTSRSVMVLTRSLVVFQIVVTSILLIGALLQIQEVIRRQTVDYGYDTGGVLATRMGLMEGDYPTSAERQLFYERLLRELRATPQFASVAFSNRLRMIFSGDAPVEIEGRAYLADSDRTFAEFENVSAGYFETLGIRVVEGRDFTDLDSDQREPVAIVNAQFARKHFGQESALGRRFRTIQQNGTNPGPWRTIVGVVSNVRMQNPFDNESDGTGFYVPFFSSVYGPIADEPVATQFGTAIVRPQPGQRPEALAQVLQNVVKKVDPNLPVYFTSTPQVAISGALAPLRTVAVMFGVFGAMAVLLAAVGLYGVMSFSVNQRTQEFGVRMALGADASRILRMVLRQGLVQLVIGLVVGLGAALLIATFGAEAIQQLIFQISPRDPLTYRFVGLLVTAVAVFATLVPALRATRVSPMIALRAE